MRKIERNEIGINQAKGRARPKRWQANGAQNRYLEIAWPQHQSRPKSNIGHGSEDWPQEIFGAEWICLDSINGSCMRFDRSIIVAEKLSGKLTVPVADLGQIESFSISIL